jgi:hypothetical protein
MSNCCIIEIHYFSFLERHRINTSCGSRSTGKGMGGWARGLQSREEVAHLGYPKIRRRAFY